ncbi:MAG: hypothetical protein M1436_02135 [Acidobacteria bacterium]|nr:hypothetical protein [Acidobacteriota bacterium]
MAVGGLGFGGKALVNGAVEGDIAVGPLLQQVAIGRADEGAVAPDGAGVGAGEALERGVDLVVVAQPASALGKVVEALSVRLRFGQSEVAQVLVRGGPLPVQAVGGADAHPRQVPFHARELRNQPEVFRPGAHIIAGGEEFIGPFQHQSGGGRGIGLPQGVFEREQGGSGAHGGVGERIEVVDALVVAGSLRKILPGFVAHGQRQIAVGLGQVRVVFPE